MFSNSSEALRIKILERRRKMPSTSIRKRKSSCVSCSWFCTRSEDSESPDHQEVLVKEAEFDLFDRRNGSVGSDAVSFYSAEDCGDQTYLPGDDVSLDNTFPMGASIPHRSIDPSGTAWSHCSHELFRIRTGPNYKKNGLKAPSLSFLYEPFGVDVLRSDVVISNIARHLLFPQLPEYYDPACGLPALLVINTQLPSMMPSMFSSPESDPGFSCLTYYKIRKETVAWALDAATAPAALGVFKKLLAKGFSERSLAFKAIGMIHDIEGEDLPMKSLITKYNGKPVLVTASSTFHFGSAPYPYLEIDYNVRKWSILARTTLVQLVDKIKSLTVHVGHLVEATDNEDLPERMLGGISVHHLDLQGAKYVKFD